MERYGKLETGKQAHPPAEARHHSGVEGAGTLLAQHLQRTQHETVTQPLHSTLQINTTQDSTGSTAERAAGRQAGSSEPATSHNHLAEAVQRGSVAGALSALRGRDGMERGDAGGGTRRGVQQCECG